MSQTSDVAQGQVSRSAAEVYEAFFVPALFGEWSPRLAQAACIQRGDRVLDVACGTGVLARHVATHVEPTGSIVGLDCNSQMLAVARRKAPEIHWQEGWAERLPFASGSFDVVVSQFGLMFFEDRQKSIHEMIRVLRPGGRLAVAVWDSFENSPGYAALIPLLERLFGVQVADALRYPFVLGDSGTLRSLFAEAGLGHVVTTTQVGTARFPSIESWMYTDIRGWTLSGLLDDADFQRLLTEATVALQPYVDAEGAVAFSAPAHIVSATRK